MKKLSINEQYEKYKKWYFEQQNKVLRQGGQMFSPMYNKQTFVNMYEQTKNELLEGVADGRRKGQGNVYQYMVREQAYPLEYKQYMSLRRAYKEAGEEINFTRFNTMSEIRYRASDNFWNFIEDKYKELRVNGSTGNAAHDWIAQQFFGSD